MSISSRANTTHQGAPLTHTPNAQDVDLGSEKSAKQTGAAHKSSLTKLGEKLEEENKKNEIEKPLTKPAQDAAAKAKEAAKAAASKQIASEISKDVIVQKEKPVPAMSSLFEAPSLPESEYRSIVGDRHFDERLETACTGLSEYAGAFIQKGMLPQIMEHASHIMRAPQSSAFLQALEQPGLHENIEEIIGMTRNVFDSVGSFAIDGKPITGQMAEDALRKFLNPISLKEYSAFGEASLDFLMMEFAILGRTDQKETQDSLIERLNGLQKQEEAKRAKMYDTMAQIGSEKLKAKKEEEASKRNVIGKAIALIVIAIVCVVAAVFTGGGTLAILAVVAACISLAVTLVTELPLLLEACGVDISEYKKAISEGPLKWILFACQLIAAILQMVSSFGATAPASFANILKACATIASVVPMAISMAQSLIEYDIAMIHSFIRELQVEMEKLMTDIMKIRSEKDEITQILEETTKSGERMVEAARQMLESIFQMRAQANRIGSTR